MSRSHRNRSKAYSPQCSHTRSKASQETMTSDKESYILDYFHNTSYKRTKNAKKQNKMQTHLMTTSDHQLIAFRIFNDYDLGFMNNVQQMITTQRIDNDIQTQDQLIETQIQQGANQLEAAIKLNNREMSRKMRKHYKQEKRLSRSQTKSRRGTK